MARLEEILARLESSLGGLSGEPMPLSGGITNHNFRVELGGQEYVVRVHGKDTDVLRTARGRLLTTAFYDSAVRAPMPDDTPVMRIVFPKSIWTPVIDG